MELDRRYITRRDFPAARRGYDPDEVDQHLRELADAVEELSRRAERPAPTSVAGAAADQVRIIVDAAERSAAEIEQRAEADARRTREEADADARATRERADAEAAEHVRRVEDATRAMLERANAADSQVEQVIDGFRSTTDRVIESLRSSADGMVSDLRTGAESLSQELEEIRRGLGDVRAGRPSPEPAAPPPSEPPPAAAEAPRKLQGDELLPGDVRPTETTAHRPAEGAPPAGREPGPPAASRESGPPAASRESGPPAVARESAPSDPGPADAEPDVVGGARESVEAAAGSPPERAGASSSAAGSEGARLIALNMALNGAPRRETAAYLAENFDLPDQDALLDEVYSRVGG